MSGSTPWSPLEEHAFETANAAEANQEIARVRDAVRAQWGNARSVEVVIGDSQSPKRFRSDRAPLLKSYLEDVGAPPSTGEGPTFLSVFLGERLLFMTPSAFFRALDLAAGPIALLP